MGSLAKSRAKRPVALAGVTRIILLTFLQCSSVFFNTPALAGLCASSATESIIISFSSFPYLCWLFSKFVGDTD